MNEEYIKQALLWYITGEEKELASRVSYGDLGKILAENHGKHCEGKANADFTVHGSRKGVRVVRGKDVAELTWNKAAKIICGEIVVQNNNTMLTDSYMKAVSINRNIIVNAQAAQMSLYEVCKGLKEMRDGKLYKELGYQNFKEYCENEVGISYDMSRKYIMIFENLDPGQPFERIGVSKLYLLSTLSEEERVEIAENTDLETVSKRELEEKVKEIKSLREKNNELNRENDSMVKQRESLINQCDKLEDQVANLENQIEELESRPIDIAVCESDSHEIENLKKAMKTCDDMWAKKYGEMEEENIKFTRQLHQDYKAQIEHLTADYEKKLAEVSIPTKPVSEQVAVPDVKETFKAYLSIVYNAFNTMIEFAQKQSGDDRQFCLEKSDKLISIFKEHIQEDKNGEII